MPTNATKTYAYSEVSRRTSCIFELLSCRSLIAGRACMRRWCHNYCLITFVSGVSPTGDRDKGFGAGKVTIVQDRDVAR
jgi:hypothetical protein